MRQGLTVLALSFLVTQLHNKMEQMLIGMIFI